MSATIALSTSIVIDIKIEEPYLGPHPQGEVLDQVHPLDPAQLGCCLHPVLHRRAQVRLQPGASLLRTDVVRHLQMTNDTGFMNKILVINN